MDKFKKFQGKFSALLLTLIFAVSFFSNTFASADESSGEVIASVETINSSSPTSTATETSSATEKVSEATSSEVPDTTDLEAKLNELKKQSESIQKNIDSIKAEKNGETAVNNQIAAKISNVEGQISIINTQINNLNKSISSLESEIATLNETIVQKEKDIVVKEEEYDAAFKAFQDRLVALYIAGDSSTLEILLTAENFEEALSNTEYLKAIASKDESTMNTLLDQKNAIITEKESIEAKKVQVEENKTQLAADKVSAEAKRVDQQALKSELAVLKGQSDSALNEINENLTEQLSEKKMTDAEAAKIESEIQAIIAEHADPEVAYSGGTMAWPVPSAKTVSMAYMGYANHTGMDITDGKGTTSGKTVVAANAGKVIMVVRGYTGYGHYVIIDHGGGITTLYAHMSSISVSVGQEVARGATIGAVGSTGNSTGPHLHFEVRINGKHTNPAGYVSAG